ncbi:MAG: cytochrome C [Desulfuromonas sp.]|nr:MAG: cytochrome C [Desulfuromonas sp.]
MAIDKRDWIFIVVIIAVFGTFFAISGEEKTVHVPDNEIHAPFPDMVASMGKKETEVFCRECHDTEEMPLSEEHPPPFRCLFCHKFNE